MSTSANRPFLTVPLTKGLSAKKVREGLARGNRLTDVGLRTLAFYLNEMQSRGLFAETGHVSATHYAESRLGLKRRTARHCLAVGQALDELPLIDEAFLDGRLNWSKLRTLVPVATPSTEAEWLEKALTLTCTDLERAVAGARKGDRPRSGRLAIPKVRYTVAAKLDGESFALWEKAKERLSHEAGESMTDAELMRHVARLVLDGGEKGGAIAGVGGATTVVVTRCSDCHAAQVGAPDGKVAIEPSAARAIECDAACGEDSLRERVLARDGGRCVHCNRPFDLHAHHIHPRSKGGPDRESNLATLCRHCHGLLHDGCLFMSGTAPHGLAITDKDGNPIAARTGSGGEGIVVRVRAPRGPYGPRVNSEVVDLKQLPNPVTPSFLARHRHLFDFSTIDGEGEVGFTPGAGRELAPESAPAAPPPAGRPSVLEEFVGQGRVRATLRPSIEGARRRGVPLKPVLLSGTPGLGKTALAYAIAGEMGRPPRVLAGSTIKEQGKTLESLLSMSDGDVLFIDEVHALPQHVMVSLYEAIQDRRISIAVRSGSESRAMVFELPKLTMIAATSEPEKLDKPLESRFAFRLRLEPYSPEELAVIVTEALRAEGRTIGDAAALVVGKASRGIPREAIHLADRVESAAGGDEPLDADRARAILAGFHIDENGLDEGDHRILEALRDAKRPLSLRTLAARTAILEATILERHEPFLIRLKLLDVTPLGRVAA